MKKTILFLLVAVGLISSASSADVIGNGSGNIGYPTYSGVYRNLTISLELPLLNGGDFFSSGEFTLNYGFNRGAWQEYQNGRIIKINLNSLQSEQWMPDSSAYQVHTFALNYDTLAAISGSSGNVLYATVDLQMPYGFDRFTQSGYVTIDSSQISLESMPEPSPYALFGIGAIGMLMVLRRKKGPGQAF
jgi:hypothetical protein